MALHRSRAAFRIALDGDTSPATASSRLLVSPIADATIRRPGCRALVLARWRVVVSSAARFSVAPGFLLPRSRIEELLDSFRHVVTLVALELV